MARAFASDSGYRHRPHALAGERRLDRRCDPVDSIGFFNHRRVAEFRGCRVDMATGCNHEGYLSFAKSGRDGPDILALEVDVEDGKIEAALIHLLQRGFHGIAGAPDLMPERIQKILEHHRNERLVFDNKNGSPRHLASE